MTPPNTPTLEDLNGVTTWWTSRGLDYWRSRVTVLVTPIAETS